MPFPPLLSVQLPLIPRLAGSVCPLPPPTYAGQPAHSVLHRSLESLRRTSSLAHCHTRILGGAACQGAVAPGSRYKFQRQDRGNEFSKELFDPNIAHGFLRRASFELPKLLQVRWSSLPLGWCDCLVIGMREEGRVARELHA